LSIQKNMKNNIQHVFKQYPLAGFAGVFFILALVSDSGFLWFVTLILAFIAYITYAKKQDDVLQVVRSIFSKEKKDYSVKQEFMETVKPHRKRSVFALLGGIIIILIVLIFINSFWVIVDAGETGVQSLFGKVRDSELHSGFHVKNPFVHVTKMNIRTQDYTMSIATGEGNRYASDAISALTKEGLSVVLDMTVLYHVVEEQASDIYRDVGLGYSEVIIRPAIRAVIREVIAEYDAKDIYSEKRQEATITIKDRLNAKLQNRGIELEDVLLRHVELPEDLANSIQEKLRAEQEAQRYDFILESEQKEAERKRISAEGQRDAQQIINQSLTQNYLNYLYIESLKDREGTIYVPTNASNGVPLFRGL